MNINREIQINAAQAYINARRFPENSKNALFIALSKSIEKLENFELLTTEENIFVAEAVIIYCQQIITQANMELLNGKKTHSNVTKMKQLDIFSAEAREQRPKKAKEQGKGKNFYLGLANDETKEFTTNSGKVVYVTCRHRFIQGTGKGKILYYEIDAGGLIITPLQKVGVLNYLVRN